MNSWNDLLCHERISNLLNEFGCQHDHTIFLELTKPLNWNWPQWPTSGAWWPPWWSHDLWFYCTLGQCAIFCPLQGCMWNTLAIGTFIEAILNFVKSNSVISKECRILVFQHCVSSLTQILCEINLWKLWIPHSVEITEI